jgi:hypothetical protein
MLFYQFLPSATSPSPGCLSARRSLSGESDARSIATGVDTLAAAGSGHTRACSCWPLRGRSKDLTRCPRIGNDARSFTCAAAVRTPRLRVRCWTAYVSLGGREPALDDCAGNKCQTKLRMSFTAASICCLNSAYQVTSV